MPAVKTSLGDRLLEMAERLDSEIEAKLADRQDNTPKRQKEAACARIEGNHLQRTQVVLRVLGTIYQHGLTPASPLDKAKTKAVVHDALRTSLDTSGGYYSIRDTGEYSRTDDLSRAIQKCYVDATSSPEQKARAAEQARRQKITEMEANIRFANIPGFFPTPREVIDMMLTYAKLHADCWLLEPSAGKGDILDEVRDRQAVDPSHLMAIERNHSLCEILKAKNYALKTADFLEYMAADCPKFDRILMNPPFEKGQDIDHVVHAYDFLKTGGRIVAVMSSGTMCRDDKKATGFRSWLSLIGGHTEPIPDGAFKSGFVQTGVSTVLVVIDK